MANTADLPQKVDELIKARKEREFALRNTIATKLPFKFVPEKHSHVINVVYEAEDGRALHSRPATEVELLLFGIYMSLPDPAIQ